MEPATTSSVSATGSPRQRTLYRHFGQPVADAHFCVIRAISIDGPPLELYRVALWWPSVLASSVLLRSLLIVLLALRADLHRQCVLEQSQNFPPIPGEM